MFNVSNALAEIKEIAEKHDLMDFKLVAMYGPRYAETVAEKLQCHAWTHYNKFTEDSQSLIRAEIKGTTEHLKKVAKNKVKIENSPKVKVRMLGGKNKGKIREVANFIAEDYVADGFAELV